MRAVTVLSLIVHCNNLTKATTTQIFSPNIPKLCPLFFSDSSIYFCLLFTKVLRAMSRTVCILYRMQTTFWYLENSACLTHPAFSMRRKGKHERHEKGWKVPYQQDIRKKDRTEIPPPEKKVNTLFLLCSNSCFRYRNCKKS